MNSHIKNADLLHSIAYGSVLNFNTMDGVGITGIVTSIEASDWTGWGSGPCIFKVSIKDNKGEIRTTTVLNKE